VSSITANTSRGGAAGSAASRRRPPRLQVVAAAGLLAGMLAMALTLSEGPVTLARVSTTQHTYLGSDTHTTIACQSGEVLPRQTTAIRLRIFAYLGPRVTVHVLDAGHAIASGEHGAGWTGGVVSVPVRPLPTTRTGVKLCFALFLNGIEPGELVGEATTGPQAAQVRQGSVPGRVRVEYLRPGDSSWWSLALSVARRMGIGHAWSGTWLALLAGALMGGVMLVCARLMLRELR
jgi:hypothetical protein